MRIKIDPESVAKTFSSFADNSSFQESAQLFARGLPIAEMIQAFAMNRNVLQAFAAFESIYPRGNLERGILEKVILQVSQLHKCQFCTASHLAIMKDLGLAADLASPGLHTPREHLAIEYAARITLDSNQIPDALFARLHELFTNAELVELTFLVGFITMLNRFNNALQVRYHGEYRGLEIH